MRVLFGYVIMMRRIGLARDVAWNWTLKSIQARARAVDARSNGATGSAASALERWWRETNREGHWDAGRSPAGLEVAETAGPSSNRGFGLGAAIVRYISYVSMVVVRWEGSV